MTVQKTKISWCDSTWNPTVGCTKISAGCQNCYAEGITHRFLGHRFDDIRCHPERLRQVSSFTPLLENGLRVPRMIFVNSMSDLHHEAIPDAFRHAVYDAMETAPDAIFQVLTKRPGPMSRFLRARYGNQPTPSNFWFGVSIENNDVRKRIDVLRSLKSRHAASCAFVSVEPLMGPIDACDFREMDWILIGGESGARCRPMDVQWLRQALTKAQAANAAVWFKQYGNAKNNPHVVELARLEGISLTRAFQTAVERGLERAPDEKGGATLDGKTYRELPVAWFELARRLIRP